MTKPISDDALFQLRNNLQADDRASTVGMDADIFDAFIARLDAAEARVEALEGALEMADAAACNGYAAFTNQGKWDWAIHDRYREAKAATAALSEATYDATEGEHE